MFGLLTASLVNRTLIKNICAAQFATQAEYYSILIKYLKIDPVTAKTISQNAYRRLRLFKATEIIRNCLTCREHNVSLTELEYITRCLALRNYTLENRIHMLQEMGVRNLNIKHIAIFCYTIKDTAKKFKHKHNIPPTSNLAINMIKSLGVTECNFSELNKLSDKDLVYEQYKAALLYFKLYILPEEYTVIPIHKERKKYRYRSLRLLSRILDFLHNELNFSARFIKTHSYLLNTSVQNARAVIAGLQDTTIDGQSFTELLYAWPHILSCDVENVKKLLELFKEYNIPNGAVSKCYEILTLESGVFVERMLRIQNMPELKDWCNHPRVLYLILHAKLITSRVQTLLTMDLERYTKHELILGFNRILKTLMYKDEKNHGKRYLKLFLSIEFGSLGPSLESSMFKHPFWQSAPVQNMQDVLRYLKEHYTLEDIAKNVQIILYPIERVKSIVNHIREENGPGKQYNFTPSQQLAYTLYLLEKDCNFSGNGVWSDDVLENTEHMVTNKAVDINHLKEIVDRNLIKNDSSTVNSGNTNGKISKKNNTTSSRKEEKMLELKV